MQRSPMRWIVSAFVFFVLVSVACSSVAPAAPTSTPLPSSTATPAPTATSTPKPTSTPRPTATPNLAATQETESRIELLQSYVDAGYLTSTSGKFEDLYEFHEQWAQLFWYKWWPIDDKPTKRGDLVFHGHYGWETATRTSDLSGCGIVFGVQPNDDHYGVFIDKARIAFLMSRGGNVYQVGKTRGSGRLSITEPAEADVDVLIKGAKSYVVVDGDVTEYTLSADQSSSGEFAYSLLSGTNKDYGTRCDITDAYIWTPGN